MGLLKSAEKPPLKLRGLLLKAEGLNFEVPPFPVLPKVNVVDKKKNTIFRY